MMTSVPGMMFLSPDGPHTQHITEHAGEDGEEASDADATQAKPAG